MDYREYMYIGNRVDKSKRLTIRLAAGQFRSAIIERTARANCRRCLGSPVGDDPGRRQDRTVRGKAPVECAIDGWS